MPRAPKPFLPPQGGEKWLCIFTFLFMMFRFTPASSQSDTSIIKIIIMFTFHTIVFLLWLLLSISFSCNNSYFHFLVITLTFQSIVSLVAVIYCIVIIYLPSLIEAETNFVVSICVTIKGSVLEKRKVTFETIGCCRGQSDAQQQRLTGTSPTPFR